MIPFGSDYRALIRSLPSSSPRAARRAPQRIPSSPTKPSSTRLGPKTLRPLLLKRFPKATDDQLREAHAYAYGGAIIQDMGYYPFGSKFFSDLVHYTRSGDFVLAMLQDAQESPDWTTTPSRWAPWRTMPPIIWAIQWR